MAKGGLAVDMNQEQLVRLGDWTTQVEHGVEALSDGVPMDPPYVNDARLYSHKMEALSLLAHLRVELAEYTQRWGEIKGEED